MISNVTLSPQVAVARNQAIQDAAVPSAASTAKGLEETKNKIAIDDASKNNDIRVNAAKAALSLSKLRV
jgi:hypothetical protein